MQKLRLTGPIAAGLGLLFGIVSACAGSDGSTEGGSDETTGSDGSTTSQEGDSSGGSSGSSDGEASSSSSDGESSATSDGSGGSGGSEGGETSTTEGEGSGGSEGGETSTTEGGGSGGTEGGETSSTDGEVGDNCPEERPEVEAACEVSGAECTYPGECRSQTLVCREGQWRNSPSESDTAGTCERIAAEGYPESGQSCGCEELRCEFNDCEERGHIVATCNGETWTVEASACEGDGGGENQGTRCGPGEGDSALFCGAGEVCVATQAGEETNFDCAENPCGDAETSCECAGDLCGETDALMCQIREEGFVVACVAAGVN